MTSSLFELLAERKRKKLLEITCGKKNKNITKEEDLDVIIKQWCVTLKKPLSLAARCCYTLLEY